MLPQFLGIAFSYQTIKNSIGAGIIVHRDGGNCILGPLLVGIASKILHQTLQRGDAVCGRHFTQPVQGQTSYVEAAIRAERPRLADLVIADAQKDEKILGGVEVFTSRNNAVNKTAALLALQ